MADADDDATKTEDTEQALTQDDSMKPKDEKPKPQPISPEKGTPDEEKSKEGRSSLPKTDQQKFIEEKTKPKSPDAPASVDAKNVGVPTDETDINSKIRALFQDGAQKTTGIDRIVRPKLIFANTYQLGPLKHFSTTQVERCIESTLKEVLTGMKYNTMKAISLTGTLAEIIRDRVLTFHFDRYKIIVLVSIGPMARQGVEIGFKCLWDSTRDSYARGEFRNNYIFASASVYGVYYD